MQPLDSLTLSALITEIKPIILDKRVDKIWEIDRHSLIILFKSKTSLLICVNPMGARICLVEGDNYGKTKTTIYENKNNQGFIILLKKYLINAKLIDISCALGERIVSLTFLTTDALGSQSKKNLNIELMGKHSNIILFDSQTKKILGSSHNVSLDMSRDRQIMTNILYELPTVTNQQNIFNTNYDKFITTINSQNALDLKDKLKISSFLTSKFKGIGKDLALEIIKSIAVSDDFSRLQNNKSLIDQLWFKINDLKTCTKFNPGINNDLNTYSIFNLANETNYKAYTSINSMVANYYWLQEQKLKFTLLQEKLLGKLKLEERKLKDKLITIEKFLANETDINKLKKMGDLIYTNLSDLQPGQESIIVHDFESNTNLNIDLDINLSLSQNAQKFHKQYQKAKLKQKNYQESHLSMQNKLTEILAEISYIEQCKTLAELQILQKGVNNNLRELNKSNDKSTILKLVSKDGAFIFIGRNSYQNEELFNKIARDEDYWFHVLGNSGAHVLLRLTNPKQAAANNLIEEAASLAAKFSKNKDNSKILVVYTKYKYVTKINRGKAGQVKYEREKTITVNNNWSIFNTNITKIL